MKVYRDDRNALRARLEALNVAAAEREARVTRAFWRCLPREAVEELDALRRRGVPAGRSPDAVFEALKALEAWCERFDAQFDRLREFESSWSTVPTEVPDAPRSLLPRGRAPRKVHPPSHALTLRLERILRALDPSCTRATWTSELDPPAEPKRQPLRYEITARLAPGGAPVRLRFVYFAPAAPSLDGSARDERPAMITLTTAVRAGCGSVVVRPETWSDSLFRFLRIRRLAHARDDAFSSFFVVEGDPEAARNLLDRDVRKALLAVARVDVPTLVVEPPGATLRWCYEPTPETLKAAVECLAALHRAPSLPLVKDRPTRGA